MNPYRNRLSQTTNKNPYSSKITEGVVDGAIIGGAVGAFGGVSNIAAGAGVGAISGAALATIKGLGSTNYVESGVSGGLAGASIAALSGGATAADMATGGLYGAGLSLGVSVLRDPGKFIDKSIDTVGSIIRIPTNILGSFFGD